MPNFVVSHIQKITGRIRFYKLVIDGHCEYDEFWVELKKQGNQAYKKENSIQSIFWRVAQLKSLPSNKWKELKGQISEFTEYEAKANGVRVFLFHDTDYGRIIVCAAKKTNQDDGISEFRKVIRKYIEAKRNGNVRAE